MAICGAGLGDENNRGISGGQRKRVNIGMELVADPTILFLGKPRISSRIEFPCARMLMKKGFAFL
jgi:ABC-type uncharacterized transport system YnjBCD ATPase subunit